MRLCFFFFRWCAVVRIFYTFDKGVGGFVVGILDPYPQGLEGFVVSFWAPSLGHLQKYGHRQFIYGHPYSLYMALVMEGVYLSDSPWSNTEHVKPFQE